jgi:hypothetical protein
MGTGNAHLNRTNSAGDGCILPSFAAAGHCELLFQDCNFLVTPMLGQSLRVTGALHVRGWRLSRLEQADLY